KPLADRPRPGPEWSRRNHRATPNDPPPARRLDSGGWASSSQTDPGAWVAPGPSAAGEICCDDTARTETGPRRDKSNRTRQLVRDDPSCPPREGAGGDRPRGVLGVSPARRMQFDPLAPTRRDDSAEQIADSRTCLDDQSENLVDASMRSLLNQSGRFGVGTRPHPWDSRENWPVTAM